MIKSFKHKGLRQFFIEGSTKGIQAIHTDRLAQLLLILNAMTSLDDLKAPSYRLHPLKGNLKGMWSVTVQANWRLTFKFEDKDVYILDYQDYH